MILSIYFVIYQCKGKTWKGKMTKNRFEREERSDTYLTYVCRQLPSVESPERTDRKQKLSANAVTYTSTADESHRVG